MTSWMGWNAVTRLKPLLLLFVFSVNAFSAPASVCEKRWAEYQDSKLFRGWEESPQKLSEDALIRLVLDIERTFNVLCPTNARVNTAQEIKIAYLKRLGVRNPKTTQDVDRLFAGLLFPQDEGKGVPERISQLKSQKNILKSLFGAWGEIEGVLWVAEKPVSPKALIQVINDQCGAGGLCSYWDSQLIFKVVVTEVAGVGAYIPELASLVLSRELIEKPTKVNKHILFHELAHAAIERERVVNDVDWVKEFPKPGRTLASDPEEFLADQIAAYAYTPEKSCPHSRLRRWLKRSIFQKEFFSCS